MDDYDVEEIMAEPNEPTLFSSIANGFALLQANAWFIVAAVGLLYYLWKNKLSSKFYEWLEDRKLNELAAKHKKDPEVLAVREEARMSAIKRLQEQYDKQAEKAQETVKEKEEKKRQEMISRLNLQGGRKLSDNYYPLAGNSSRGYIAPQRKTGCPGSCK
ncbi:hypothetical protein RUM43_012039 [Polyplax serrata]|uniref:Selenoprotein S n=1 Tax=Polyplax serrata TaxID=468196 RepID=A0AAN8PK39_POLSC